MTFIDWLIISAGIKRPIRFVMYYKFFQIPFLKYLFRHTGVIPIAGSKEDPEIFQRSFELVAEELRQGELVCIFPEGALTKDGKINEFKKGVEHILAQTPVLVVPMVLHGLWGSVYNHKDKPALQKLPKRF